MTITIDKAGRIVLPKSVRDRLGLSAGSELELDEVDDAIVLKPPRSKSPLVRKGRLLVHTGKIVGNSDLTAAIERTREERARHILGR